MISKVCSFFLSDRKLCHRLLRSRKFYCLILGNTFTRAFTSLEHLSSSILSCKNLLPPSSRLNMSADTNCSAFHGKEDRFEGITVLSDTEPCDVLEFPERLKNSLETWRTTRKRGIWFKVHLNHCEWVPILVKNGFKYHHAKEDYVMLYLWLPSNESNNIPNYAHTMVGVGAVVVNERDQVLVVKEKYFHKTSMWKLPGGYVEPGENLVDAAIREVLEETGIQTVFESLLTLRQTHHGMFGCSDIYAVVNLRCVNENIQRCEREIAECQWMDINEYLNHPHVHELNRFFVTKLLHYRKNKIKIDCRHGIHQVLQKPYTVYSVVNTDDIEVPDTVSCPFEVGESSKFS